MILFFLEICSDYFYTANPYFTYNSCRSLKFEMFNCVVSTTVCSLYIYVCGVKVGSTSILVLPPICTKETVYRSSTYSGVILEDLVVLHGT